MAELAVGMVLEVLGGFPYRNSYYQRKFMINMVKKQVEEITSELLVIQSFIKDADAKQSKEEHVQHWVKKIKDLTYRIEDIIETFFIHVDARNEKNIREWKIKRFFKETYLVRAFQLETENVKSSFTKLRQYRETFGITEAGSSSTSVNKNLLLTETLRSYHPKGEHLSVGLDEDMELLLSCMLDEDRNYQVISVCGMVGIGKTTLARLLCNHGRIRYSADHVAFVHVSQHPIKVVFKSILCQFFKDNPEEIKNIKYMMENQLADNLRSFQQEHRCFIFLDNIQSTDVWERLRIAFPLENTATKLVITTRSLEVAKISTTAGKGIIHRMRCLTDKDACKLFTQHLTLQKRPELNAIDPEMMNIGRDLIKQCKGLPLGIISVVEMFKLQQWSISHDKIRVFAEVVQALTPIYFELPYQLKSCLFYIATFGKDTKVRPEKLYHMWMAEGLTSLYQNQSEMMMHIADSYLNELRLRCMVYVQEEEVPTAARRFKSCSLHDLIHEFCLFMGRQEDFFVVMENEQVPEPSSSNDSTRRVVFYVGKNDNTKLLSGLTEKLRCLLVKNTDNNQEAETYEMLSDLINCIMESKFLRILDFDGINFGSRKIPKGISNLVHLRYLSFTGCVLHSLPASIGYLLYLQILDLRVKKECKMEIPNVLKKMKRLRHLYLPLTFQTRAGDRLRLDGLTLLETLENFNMEVGVFEDLSTLTKIQYLTVNIEGNFENLKRLIDFMNMASENVLRSTINIKKLDCYADEWNSVFKQLLSCPTLHVLYIGGHLGQLPPHTKISKNLSKIVLRGSQLEIDPMPALEKLPNLRVLILKDDAFVRKRILCSASNFPELRRLELSNLYDLESWSVEEGAMPKLSTLVIENCSELEMLPEGLRFLTNLQELTILKMPETFYHRLAVLNDEGGEDRDKVPEVTSIIFDDDNESSGLNMQCKKCQAFCSEWRKRSSRRHGQSTNADIHHI